LSLSLTAAILASVTLDRVVVAPLALLSQPRPDSVMTDMSGLQCGGDLRLVFGIKLPDAARDDALLRGSTRQFLKLR
jgi:hypothetical protein